MEAPPLGSVWTFYSYKGGVGRSLALANVAALLAKWGYRTLCVDWDLEAPGLQLYFEPFLRQSNAGGVVELVRRHAADERPDWRDYCAEVSITGARGTLEFIAAGKLDRSYVRRMQDLDWETLYSGAGLGAFLEGVRDEWKREYDVVLIDSRTGVTDIGGVCTVQLPDFLAILFTANRQSIEGAIDVAARAGEAINSLPFDRARLPALPIVTRFEGTTEVDLARHWLGLIQEKISPVVANWLDRSVSTESLCNHIKVPYVPRWSFGECLPVLEEGTSDPLSIGYAFETIAALVAHGLENSALLAGYRSSYVDAAIRGAESRTEAPSEKYEFDVFVSYEHNERKYARELIKELTGRGLRVWSDLEQMEGGIGSMVGSLADGLARSRNMVALVGVETTKWLESEYRQFLLGSLSEADDDRLFIPVLRVPGAMGKSRQLSQFRSVDASNRSPAEVAEELGPLLAGGIWAA